MRPLCFSNAANSVRAVDFRVCTCILRRRRRKQHDLTIRINVRQIRTLRFFDIAPGAVPERQGFMAAFLSDYNQISIDFSVCIDI